MATSTEAGQGRYALTSIAGVHRCPTEVGQPVAGWSHAPVLECSEATTAPGNNGALHRAGTGTPDRCCGEHGQPKKVV